MDLPRILWGVANQTKWHEGCSRAGAFICDRRAWGDRAPTTGQHRVKANVQSVYFSVRNNVRHWSFENVESTVKSRLLRSLCGKAACAGGELPLHLMLFMVKVKHLHHSYLIRWCKSELGDAQKVGDMTDKMMKYQNPKNLNSLVIHWIPRLSQFWLVYDRTIYNSKESLKNPKNFNCQSEILVARPKPKGSSSLSSGHDKDGIDLESSQFLRKFKVSFLYHPP